MLLVLLAGCDQLFGIGTYPPVAAGADARPYDAAPQPMVVQTQVMSNASASQLMVALGHPPMPQDVLIAIGGAQNGVTSIAGAGVAWQLAASSVVSPTSYMWYGMTDGSTSQIELATGAAGEMWLLVTEWTQLDVSATFDAENANGLANATTGSVDLSLTTTSGPDLLVFAVSSYGTIGDPTGTWQQLPPAVAGSLVQHAWYRFSTAPGVETAQATSTSDWDATLAAFRTAR